MSQQKPEKNRRGFRVCAVPSFPVGRFRPSKLAELQDSVSMSFVSPQLSGCSRPGMGVGRNASVTPLQTLILALGAGANS